MTESTPNLNKALAELQAELPQVEKGKTGKIPGKDGKQGYSYQYADLTDVSYALLPLLGKHGLAFSAKPTLNAEGKFVLAYALKHESGEQDAGEFPLVGANTPQQVGSLITYARRYSLCSVTGVAPGGEDDDGAAAEHGARSAGDAWDSAQPSRPAQTAQRSGNGNGTVSRPAQRPQQPAQPAPDDELIVAWAAKVDEITSQEDADRADAELKEVFKAKKIDATQANAIRRAIRDKAQSVMAGAAA